jgi:hypothetical protein
MKLSRKKKTYTNPFLITDEWGETDNILWQLDYIHRAIEDIIVGCTRSINAASTHKQDTVNWYKIYKLYRNVNELTRASMKSYLRCSDRQLTRYIQVVELCTPFIKQYYRKHPDEKMY